MQSRGGGGTSQQAASTKAPGAGGQGPGTQTTSMPAMAPLPIAPKGASAATAARKPIGPKKVAARYNDPVASRSLSRYATAAARRQISWHPSTKRAWRKTNVVQGGRRPGTIDLNVQGNTHRVLEKDTKAAVINRTRVQRPADLTEDGDVAWKSTSSAKDKWLEEQLELTKVLNSSYGLAAITKPKGTLQGEGEGGHEAPAEYVPKPRRTQRAKQNTARKRAQAVRPTGLQSGLGVLEGSYARLRTGRKKYVG